MINCLRQSVIIH